MEQQDSGASFGFPLQSPPTSIFYPSVPNLPWKSNLLGQVLFLLLPITHAFVSPISSKNGIVSKQFPQTSGNLAFWNLHILCSSFFFSFGCMAKTSTVSWGDFLSLLAYTLLHGDLTKKNKQMLELFLLLLGCLSHLFMKRLHTRKVMLFQGHPAFPLIQNHWIKEINYAIYISCKNWFMLSFF